MSGVTESGFAGAASIPLSEAARRVGCHVETLRERVRDGRLEATRGAHGRYYVTEAALSRMKPPAKPILRSFSPEVLEASWVWLEDVLSHDQRYRRSEEAIVAELRLDPSRDAALYRLLSVQRLLAAGLGCEEVARELIISARHVRRLRHRDARQALRSARARKGSLNIKDRERRAREIVADLRSRLEAAGFRRHERTYLAYRHGQRLPAFRVQRLPDDLLSRLRSVGLTDEQITAVAMVGIGVDELNQLLLYGLPDDARG